MFEVMRSVFSSETVISLIRDPRPNFLEGQD